MTYENNLGVVLPLDTQQNKVATIADALLRIGEAVSSRMSYDFTAGDVNVTLDQFQRNGLHILRSITVARNFVLPVGKRWAYVVSDPANTADATIVLGTASYALTPGAVVLIATDGTANGLSVYGLGAAAGASGASAGLADAPSDAVTYGRHAAGWAPVVEEAPDDTTLYGRKGKAWVAMPTGGGGSGGALAYDRDLIVQHYDQGSTGGTPDGFPYPPTVGNWVIAFAFTAATTVPPTVAGWTALRTQADPASRHSGGVYIKQVTSSDTATMMPIDPANFFVASLFEVSGRFGLDTSFVVDTLTGAADRNSSGVITVPAFTPTAPELFLDYVDQRPIAIGALSAGNNLDGVYPWRADGGANRSMQSGLKTIDPAAEFTPAPAWTASGDVQIGYGHIRLKLPTPQAPATTPNVVQSVPFAGNQTANVSATLPAAPTVGNYMVAIVMHAGTITAAAGWTLLNHGDPLGTDGVSILTRQVQAGDTASPTLATLGGAANVNGVFAEVSGATGIDHVTHSVNSDQGTGTSSATTLFADSRTETLPAQGLLLTCTALDATGTVGWSGLSGVTPLAYMDNTKTVVAGKRTGKTYPQSVPYSCKFTTAARWNYGAICFV